jgi:peptidoglycan/LPS O-acetylase OafA/YrhL
VAAVVTYHLGVEWLPGGFLGVDLFFVISGFLITTLLLTELERTHRIAFGQFYLRRARRLLPALFLVLAATLVIVATFAPDVVTQVLRDIPPALLYVSNWWAIGDQQSYFELIGRGNMLGHLWSLAVEEQFYLVWPAVLGLVSLAAVRIGVSRRSLVLLVATGGAVLSTAWMAYLAVTGGYPLDADPTRVYFGTDSHAMSVLVGAALATFWTVGSFRVGLAAGARAVIVGAGLVALAATGWLLLHVSEYTPWLYRGGFLVAALVFALLVAAATHPGAGLGRVLDVAPMRWVGERSYGIYLWHWPVFLVTRPGVDVAWDGVGVDLARVGLVLALAAASYRYVEVPIRHGALGRWWAGRLALRAPDTWVPGSGRGVLAVLAATGSVALLAALVVTAPPAVDSQARALAQAGDIVDTEVSAAPSVRPITAPSSAPSPSPSRSAPASASASASTRPSPSTSVSLPPAPTGGLAAGVSPADRPLPAGNTLSTADISWYGTSVSMWAVEVLRAELPGVKIDAGNNRSPGFILDRVRRDLSGGSLRPAVVMHLGDAGPVSEDDLDQMLTTLGDRVRVVVINSTARFAFVPEGNRTLQRVALRHPNVVVADWTTYSTGHADWFKDGLHLTEKGKPVFARFVRQAMLGV